MAPRTGIERIVVAVDGSEHAAAALEWATRMAKGMGSEVIAVYAIVPPVYVDASYTIPNVPVQFDPAWRDEITKEFEETWCRPLKESGVRYRTVVKDGRAASVIADVADELEADVIVVGRRGRGGVASLLLGSVSNEVVMHSKRPVLVTAAPPS